MNQEESRDDAFHLAGDRLGKFVILSELGRGSMGVVYEALQEDLKRKVALKILPANICLDKKQVQRFHREAESVARLKHDNVIQIYEVGQIEGTHYFAMELVEGQPWGALRGRDRDSVFRAARTARDAARGLAHAHERGVVHRDVKPTNIFCERDGRVVVMDFGLARLTESASLTSTDAIVGTPKYMSPEQILPRSMGLDGRTDVYSLGAALYEAVSGRVPIEAPTVQAFFKAILEERPPHPRKLNKSVPFDLCTIVLRCLEKDPADRYASAAELADDLDRFLQGERIVARPRGALALGTEWVRRHKVIVSLTAVAVLALALNFTLFGRAEDAEQGRRKAVAETEVQARISQILLAADEDIDLAVEQAEEFLAGEPNHPFVGPLRADLYGRRALQRVIQPGEHGWDAIAGDLERAGRTSNLWYPMALIEARRFRDAEALARDLPADAPLRALTLARLELERRDYDAARGHLAVTESAELSDIARFFHDHTLARLELAVGDAAARAGDTAGARERYARAAGYAVEARGLTEKLPYPWLKSRVDVTKVAIDARRGHNIDFAALFQGVTGATENALRDLSSFWGAMSGPEARNAQMFADRVLQIAKVQATILPDLVQKAERLKDEATTPRGRALGWLLLGLTYLRSDQAESARHALERAEDLGIDELFPYIYWGQSLVHRAGGNLKDALEMAKLAMEICLAGDTPFADLQHLAEHTGLLVEATEDAATRSGYAKRVLALLEQHELPATDWARALLARLTAAAAPSEPPR